MSTLPLLTQQRDVIQEMTGLPPLKGINGQKYLYILGLCSDLLLEKANQAVKIRIPGQGDPSQIPYLADDRLLSQGPAETNAAFVARIQNVFTTNRVWGSRGSILSELQAYASNLQPSVAAWTPEMAIVGGNSTVSTWDTIYNGVSGPPAHETVTNDWNWDGSYHPWRSWLILYMNQVATGLSGSSGAVSSVGGSGLAGVTNGFATLTGMAGLSPSNIGNFVAMTALNSANTGSWQIVSVLSATSCVIANPAAVAPDTFTWSIVAYPWIAPGLAWGSPGQLYGDTTRSWGLSCPSTTMSQIRMLLRRRKSAGAFYPAILVTFNAKSEFLPTNTVGFGNPGGNFGTYGANVSGVWTPQRHTLATGIPSGYMVLCDGTGSYIQCNELNVT